MAYIQEKKEQSLFFFLQHDFYCQGCHDTTFFNGKEKIVFSADILQCKIDSCTADSLSSFVSFKTILSME